MLLNSSLCDRLIATKLLVARNRVHLVLLCEMDAELRDRALWVHHAKDGTVDGVRLGDDMLRRVVANADGTETVVHRNGNPLDNQRSNLVVRGRQGEKHIHWVPARQRWRVKVKGLPSRSFALLMCAQEYLASL